ncbi:ribonuclease H-like domain-containing protein [Tanacetum coccineum]
MWLFRHKYLADGSLSRYMTHLVMNGSTQLEGVDVDETFSPVVKPGTIRTVLSLATSRHWPIHQLDVKNAFLHGDLFETVYMHQPLGFWDSKHPDYDSSGMFLSQKKYVVEILKRVGMVKCNPSQTTVDTESKLGDTGVVVSDPTLYQSLAGSLQYLTFTRLDISYAVQQLFSSSTTDLVAYSDADWAGCPTTRRSTSVLLGNNLLSWSSKRQPTLSRSSAEAKYHGVANAVAETCWLRNLLRELHTPLSSATLVYCDNVSAVYLSCNPDQHQRTKHIEIDIHFVRDLVAAGQVRVLHVPSRYQFADIFTKGLLSSLFEEFRSSLSVRCPPALTAREFLYLDAMDKNMTWESLNPTWIDEDQRHHVPKCPSLPKLSIPARMIDVIAIKLPCRNKAYYWSKDVNHLHLQLASAGLATSVKRDYAVHILFISNCTLLPNLFPCKELVTRQGNVWLYKPNLKVLREKIQLPIGSCELALPFNPQG